MDNKIVDFNGASKDISAALSVVLADSYLLYLKTHNFHWNVTGKHFIMLHEMFQIQYEELAIAVDDIAEHIRVLGFLAPGSFSEFSELSSMAEAKGDISANEMVEKLAEGHEIVIASARKALRLAADAGDDVTEGLMADRLAVHEKTRWMLRAHLG